MSINYAGSVHPITTASGWKTNFFNTSKNFYSANSWTLKSDPLQYDKLYEKYDEDKKVFEMNDELYKTYVDDKEVLENNRTSSFASTVEYEVETFTKELITTSSYEKIHIPEGVIKTSETFFIKLKLIKFVKVKSRGCKI